MLAAFIVASTYFFVRPDSDPRPQAADAVVVLSGGRGHRLAKGLELWHDGFARTLAISDGNAPGWPEANRLCKRPRVVCFRPAPYSTRGEARWTAAEARRRGWDDVVVVTSTYHVRRARRIFERCYHRRLAVVAARPPLGNMLVGVAWEWPKSVYYLALQRRC